MDINRITEYLVPGVQHYNPAYVNFTEAEAREKGFWTDDRSMPTVEECEDRQLELQQLDQEQALADEAKKWLLDNDWKYMQNMRRVSRGTITPEQEAEFKAFLEEAHEKAKFVPKENS